MAKTRPGTVKVLRTFSLPCDHRATPAAEAEDKGRDLEAVVREWMAANRKIWKK